MSRTTTRDIEASDVETQIERWQPTLVIAWAANEPRRTGQVLRVPRGAKSASFGRGDTSSRAEARVQIVEQRPGQTRVVDPIDNEFLSRDQLLLHAAGDRLRLENLGRCELRVGGTTVASVELEPGDTVELRRQLLLLCALRPNDLPPTRSIPAAQLHPFGEPDAFGFVGESPAAWALREQLAFLGARSGHVLLLGPSGSGKELCARALHGYSPRRERTLVGRNAATLPPGLVDAELFGNVRNYPNPGMAERPGLVGTADGSTLLLDEIGELPDDLQAHLLRLLDAGEYQRLGDARTLRADVRVLGR